MGIKVFVNSPNIIYFTSCWGAEGPFESLIS